MWLNCCAQCVSKLRRLSSGQRIGEGQFSFQYQRRARPKNVPLPYNCAHFTCQQVCAQNPSSQSSAVGEPIISRCTSWVQKKQRNTRWTIEKATEFQKKTSTSASLITKMLCVDDNKLRKILKEMRISDRLTCLLRNLYASQEATLRTNMEQQIGSKLEKE